MQRQLLKKQQGATTSLFKISEPCSIQLAPALSRSPGRWGAQAMIRLCDSPCPSPGPFMRVHICNNAVREMGCWAVVTIGELQGVVVKLKTLGLGLCRLCEKTLGLPGSGHPEVTDDDGRCDLSGDEPCSEAKVDAHGVSSATVSDALIFVRAAETGLCSADGGAGSSAWLRRINFSAAAAAGDGRGSAAEGEANEFRGGGTGRATGRATTPGRLVAGAGCFTTGEPGVPTVLATIDRLVSAGAALASLFCDAGGDASASSSFFVSLSTFSSTTPLSSCSSSPLLLDHAVFTGVDSC